MLRVLVDVALASQVSVELKEAIVELGAGVDSWDEESGDLYGVPDALITCASRVETVVESYAHTPRLPQIVAVASIPSAAVARRVLLQGAAGLVDEAAHPKAIALAVLSAACGWTVVPGSHGASMAQRLAEPPRELEPDERSLLELVARHTVEQAGREMGLSRRQAQRRFQALCHDLGLDNHLHAAVATSAWGLLHLEGA